MDRRTFLADGTRASLGPRRTAGRRLRAARRAVDARRASAALPGPHPQTDHNANPLGMPPRARAAVLEAMDEVPHYPGPRREVLVERLAGLHGVGADQVVLGSGSTELIRLAVHANRHSGEPDPAGEPDLRERDAVRGAVPVPDRAGAPHQRFRTRRGAHEGPGRPVAGDHRGLHLQSEQSDRNPDAQRATGRVVRVGTRERVLHRRRGLFPLRRRRELLDRGEVGERAAERPGDTDVLEALRDRRTPDRLRDLRRRDGPTAPPLRQPLQSEHAGRGRRDRRPGGGGLAGEEPPDLGRVQWRS